MDAIDGKDIALLLVAGYVAVMVLVRLMLGYRDRLIERFRDEMRRLPKRIERPPSRSTQIASLCAADRAKARADAKAAAAQPRRTAQAVK